MTDCNKRQTLLRYYSNNTNMTTNMSANVQ